MSSTLRKAALNLVHLMNHMTRMMLVVMIMATTATVVMAEVMMVRMATYKNRFSKKQEQILSRLAQLERQQRDLMFAHAQLPTNSLDDYSFDNSFADFSFDDGLQPPACIPPSPLSCQLRIRHPPLSHHQCTSPASTSNILPPPLQPPPPLHPLPSHSAAIAVSTTPCSAVISAAALIVSTISPFISSFISATLSMHRILEPNFSQVKRGSICHHL